MEFKETLRTKRTEKHLRQSDIAAQLDVDQSTYSYWETGKYEPDIKMLIKIADFFETSIDYLVGRYSKN